MMKNYFKLLWLSAFSLLFLISAGCASDPDKRVKETAEEEKQAVEATAEMTEDIYVEVTANQMYLAEKFSEKAEAEDISEAEAIDLSTEMGEKMAAMYEEHEVTGEAYEKFAQELMEDIEYFGSVMERVEERVEELRKKE